MKSKHIKISVEETEENAAEDAMPGETEADGQEPEAIEIEPAKPTPEQQYAELFDRYQRALAEFDNFRKRTMKEKAAMYDDGVRDTVEKLLPVIDNFERALNARADDDTIKEDKFYQGVTMIIKQFNNFLTETGVEQIAAAPGDAFDHNLHFAVTHAEDETLGANAIMEELQKGYKYRDKVIRPSMVKVAN